MSETWTCSACSSDVPATRSRCSQCGEPRGAERPSGRLLSKPSGRRIGKAGAPKPQETAKPAGSGPTAPQAETSVCLRCHYDNVPPNGECPLCALKRVSPKPSKADDKGNLALILVGYGFLFLIGTVPMYLLLQELPWLRKENVVQRSSSRCWIKDCDQPSNGARYSVEAEDDRDRVYPMTISLCGPHAAKGKQGEWPSGLGLWPTASCGGILVMIAGMLHASMVIRKIE